MTKSEYAEMWAKMVELNRVLEITIQSIKLRPECFMCKALNPKGEFNYLCCTYPECIAAVIRDVDRKFEDMAKKDNKNGKTIS